MTRSEGWAQLGAELRRLRTLAGLSQQDIAERTGIKQASVSRFERATGRPPTRAEVQTWLDAAGADEASTRRVLALTEAAHTEPTSYMDLLDAAGGHLQRQVREDEAASRLIRSMMLVMVPGLMQTAEYARQVIPQADPTGKIDHAAAVMERLERQKLLYEPTRRFQFLIAEHVLLWSPGPGVMPAQLDRIRSLATLSNVDVAVLPMRRCGALPWTSFTYREPADGSDPYVLIELLHGATTTSDPERVRPYVELWDRLWDAAVRGDEAVDLIRRVSESRAP